MRERLRLHLGYRGTALISLGLVWFAVGARIVTQPDDDPLHMLPIEYLPISIRSGIWFGAAAVALIVAFWPPGKTKWGYTALVIPAAFRALSYLGAVILSAVGQAIGRPEWGYADAWVDALVWSGIVGYVMLCADWPEPPDLSDGAATDGG